MLSKKWRLSEPSSIDSIQYLSNALNISPIIAQILVQRDITDAKQAKSFFKPDLNNLSEPHLIPGISQALKRIEQALLNNERILVYGDYDVDGITSVTLLKRFFRLLGREIDFYIPHRLTEGYGLSKKAIDIIAQKGVKLIITVDCGISNIEEVAYAKKSGMDIIVTDHHEIPSELPQCIIVNPKLDNSSGRTDSHFLSGVGVVFKICWSLMDTFSDVKKNNRVFHDFLMDTMALVALGTIADVSPLVGENRILCSYGLEALNYTKIAGLNALIKQTGLANSIIKAEDISFRLGPRINAPGRLGSSYSSAELLLSDSPSEIEKLIEQIERDNKERQKIEAKISQEISKSLNEEFDLTNNYVIVLSNSKWHSGVLGIAASKIAEEFYRPTILISTENGIGKGSARSIPSFHLYNALNNCRDLLISVGGHKYAAGLRIDHQKIPELRTQLNNYAQKHLKPEDFIPYILIDNTIEFSQITKKLLREINMLSPLGEGNPEPVFCSHNIQLIGIPKLIGNNLKHLTFFAKQSGRTFRVIAYNKSAYVTMLDKLKGKPFSLAYMLKLNNWQGEETIELEFVDIKV
ncbi:MAG: single-stranded-DNA-specific exonuclease RecJ [Planctomycetota bacterium]